MKLNNQSSVILKSGHFYFAQIRHYHFALTGFEYPFVIRSIYGTIYTWIMKYDVVIIFNVSVDAKTGEQKLRAFVEKDGFSISDIENLGKKRLAYPIKKLTEGMYVSAIISGSTQVQSLYNRFKVDDTVLRSLILKKLHDQPAALPKGVV